MRADVRSGIIVLHFHPCQWIGDLAGGRYSVPRIGDGVFMIGIGRIERSCRIERFLIIYQVMILLNGAEHSQFAVQEAVEHFLIHVHIRSEVFHVFIQNHSLTIHETKRNTIAGLTGTTIKGDVMVLL